MIGLRRALLLIFTVLLIAGLAGCGSKKQSGAEQGKASQTPTSKPAEKKTYNSPNELYADLAKLPEAEIEKRLVEGAKEEKTVRIYTTLDEQIMEKVKKPFEAKYPFLRVEYLSGKEADLTNRALSEFRGGKFLVDMQVGGTSGFLDIEGVVPFARHQGLPVLPDHLKQFYSDWWYSIAYSPVTMVYNNKLVKAADAPKSYQDLLDPKWSGKVAIDINPQNYITGLVAGWGEEKARKYITDLVVGNKALIRKGHTQMMDMLIAGEFPIAVELFLYKTEPTIQDGAPMEWVVDNPIPANTDSAGIYGKAPHPYAAMLFARYHGRETVAGQIIAEEGRIPVNPRVENPYPRLKKFASDPEMQKRLIPTSPTVNQKYQPPAEKILKDIITPRITGTKK